MTLLARAFAGLRAGRTAAAGAQRDDLAFLPAALEIQQTPPSPIGRGVLYVIVALFVASGLWAWFGRIDIVAVAPGKVVPSDRVKRIQPVEIGVIRAIHVEEGSAVKAGDALVTLDATSTQADFARLSGALAVAKADDNRLAAFQSYVEQRLDDPRDAFAMLDTDAQLRLLEEQINAFEARVAAAEADHSQRQAERRQVLAEIEKLQQVLPIAEKRGAALRKLLDTQMVSENAWLEVEQQRIAAKQDLLVQRGRREELDAAIEALQARADAIRAEALQQSLADQRDVRARIDALEQELRKADERDRQRTLLAPIDGSVQDLAVHTVGGVVTPAQVLLSLVPADSALEVEAFVANQDIGFVENGQAVAVKVDTFNFTRYGSIDGELVSVSDDAHTDERLGLVYRARVRLQRDRIEVDGRSVRLSPGMAVTVEVKTGHRRVIEYFLSPLMRYADERARER